MYHIKADKRAQASAGLICEGLLRCLEEKPYGEISISDLQRVSSVSRSTFYRHFDGMADVLALLCDRGFQEIAQGMGQRPIHLAVLHYWYEHGSLLEAIVQAGRIDIFQASFRRFLTEGERVHSVRTDELAFDYLLSTIVFVMIGTLAEWIRRGRRETEEQLAEALKSAFAAIQIMNMLG